MKPDIAVIIVTRNRPEKLANCLTALVKSTMKAFTVVVVDQSTSRLTQEVVSTYSDDLLVKYYKMKGKGKSRGLNLGVTKSPTQLLAFTDDDCLPHRDWLKRISEAFRKQPTIAGMFGKTLPYLPKNHPGLVCPCTFEKATSTVINQPVCHWKEIGFGNNMAFRKQVFEKFGKFETWLGPGSIGSNAEDAEFTLRLLRAGQELYYNPQAVVYHDRWLTPRQLKTQELSYSTGEGACYGYYALLGYPFAWKTIQANLRDSWGRLVKAVKTSVSAKPTLKNQWSDFGMVTLARLRGAGIALLLFVKRRFK